MVVGDAIRLIGHLVAFDCPRAIVIGIAAFLLCPALQRHFDSAQADRFTIGKAELFEPAEELELCLLCTHIVLSFYL